MNPKYDDEDIEEMIDLIKNYNVEYDDCGQISCEKCCYLEDCYCIARGRENSEWAELINYGGYDTEEEFWEQLFG